MINSVNGLKILRNFVTIAGFAVLPLNSAKAVSPMKLKEKIDPLLSQPQNNIVSSVHVLRLRDGQTIYELNKDMLLSPASVTKLITSAAVLQNLGPGFKFQTALYHTGQKRAGVIHGDLVVYGDGDPFVVNEQLWQLAVDMKHSGIREIRGGIVIDNSIFSDETRDEIRQGNEKSSSHAYDAPITAFGANFNTVAVSVAPGDKPGALAFTNIDPYPTKAVAIENHVNTAQPGVKNSISISRKTDKNGINRLVAEGHIAADSQVVKIYRSAFDGVQSSGEYLRSFLLKEGITVQGPVVEGKKPQSAEFLQTLTSYDMRRIITGLNVFSNNYIADVLLKRLSVVFDVQGKLATPGSFKGGVKILESFLRDDVGIKTNFNLKNGSGLTTENLLSAEQLTKVLAYMEKRMDLFPEFLASLPASGRDGTMEKRFKKAMNGEGEGMFRAKTGTLTEPTTVSSLAGYFRHPEHGMVAFAILENGGPAASQQPSISQLKKDQDKAMEIFINTL